jgi:folate-binding protein YgfZ
MVARVKNEAGYRAALESCARVDLSAREQLRVTGPDRVTFLHGMITNEVNGLAVGGSCFAAVLTAKGAMVGEVRVLKREDELFVDTGPGCGATVRDFFSKYLISEDAEVVDAPEIAVVGLWGPRAAEVSAGLAGTLGSYASFLEGVDLVLPREALAAVMERLSAVPLLDEETAEVLRVERGVPRWGADMSESTIPLEANLERAVSYTKGCYIGQEVIARATYRGQMNKKLMGLELGSAEVAPGTELRAGNRKVGWVTSTAHSPKRGQIIGLGYVHRDFLGPGTSVEVAGGGGAVVVALPF